MTTITSKLKTIFTDEMLIELAKVCKTRLIQNPDKIKIVHRLLIDWGIECAPLGDATNRLAVQKDAYAIKIAMDEAGYKDNWMEFSVSDELQPYVTHTFETNGYIAVAECVKSLSEDEFWKRKNEMEKILDDIGSEYLLGDVGLTMKQYKNWGIRDSGEVVILDYAYVHRATENLFLCPICGELLHYNEAFTELCCRGRDGCNTSFNYSQKRAQIPDSEIQRVIDISKDNAIVMTEARVDFNNIQDLKQTDPDTIVIRNEEDYQNYLEEACIVNDINAEGRSLADMLHDMKQGKSFNQAFRDNIGEVRPKKVIYEYEDTLLSNDFIESQEDDYDYYNDDPDDYYDEEGTYYPDDAYTPGQLAEMIMNKRKNDNYEPEEYSPEDNMEYYIPSDTLLQQEPQHVEPEIVEPIKAELIEVKEVVKVETQEEANNVVYQDEEPVNEEFIGQLQKALLNQEVVKNTQSRHIILNNK